MVSLTATINNQRGIHARPSSAISETAKKYQSKIIIVKGSYTADARDVLQLIVLELLKGDEVEVQAEGPDEREACKEVRNALEDIYEYD